MSPNQDLMKHTSRDIEITVNDHTLPLSVIEDFARIYGPNTGADVVIRSRWSGPAAGGPGWGGPEIAVAIVIGEMLRRASSDAYNLVRNFVQTAYFKIKTRQATRYYIKGALAIGVDSEDTPVRILFCFPEGLDLEALEKRLSMLERDYESVRDRFAGATKSAQLTDRTEIRVCWDDNDQLWTECEPMPEME